jgi:GTP cyclohydrolase I
MTRMAQERDSILRIRAKVDAYDEMEENTSSSDKAFAAHGNENDRIQLCSREKPLRVYRLMETVAIELSVKSPLITKLARFLRENSDEVITESQVKDCSVCVYHFFHNLYSE